MQKENLQKEKRNVDKIQSKKKSIPAVDALPTSKQKKNKKVTLVGSNSFCTFDIQKKKLQISTMKNKINL